MAKCSLTERITIEYLNKDTQDSQGFSETIWKTYYNCWACFKAIRGRDYEVAKSTQNIDTVSFIIRYCNLVKNLNTKDYRILFNNKIYIIEYIYDVNNLHNYVDIKCKCIE